MARILTFSRDRCTSVEQRGDGILIATCRLQDTLTEAWTEITVRPPDLELAAVKGSVIRSARGEEGDFSEPLRRLCGIRIGAGMLKIIDGMLKETPCRGVLAYMIEECSHGIILSFTKDVLIKSPGGKDPEADKEFYRKMVSENIRLYNRCAAFAPGSSLVEGIEPPTSSAMRP